MSDVETAQTGELAAPAEIAQEPQQPSAPAETAETPEQPRDEKGRWATQRIGELTRHWRSEQRAHEQTRQEIAQMREQLSKLAPKPDPQTDFAGYLQSEIESRVQGIQSQLTQRQQQEAQQRQAEELARSFDQRSEAFAKEHPDYNDAIDALQGTLPEYVGVAIGHSEHGPAIAYHLANHPQELAQVLNLPPPAALVALGRIEARVSTPKTKPVTNAPSPAPTVGGGAAAPKDPERMSVEDWLVWRRSQLK